MGSTRMGSSSGVTKLVRPSTIIGLTPMGGGGAASSPSSGVARVTPPSKLSAAVPSPMAVESLRNFSPPTYRNSPKFDMELFDLSNLPPAPAFKNIQRRMSMNFSPFSSNNPPNTHGENNT